MPVVSALSVGAADPDQAKLEAIFLARGWKLGRAQTRDEARVFMKNTPVRLVITEIEVPGGGWRELLEDLRQNLDPPELVVTARLADESLWAEVLNMGGYEVLAKPLDTEEVTRVVSAAMRHMDNEQGRRLKRSGKLPAKAACALAKAAEVA
jgi:two-component system, OmpR family, response regulator